MTFRPRGQLAAAMERDFERTALPYFQFVFSDITRPTPRAYWDRRGVDLMTTPEREPIEVCVQCKTTSKKAFDETDIKELLDEIDKFAASGVQCRRYILALNRNDIGGQIQAAVSAHIEKNSISFNIEVWQLSRIVDEAQASTLETIRARIKAFNEEWREQLVGRFAPSGAWVRRVPAKTFRMMLNPDEEPEIQQSRTEEVDIQALLLDPSRPHMNILIGDDGIGKTSAALITSQATDRTVIYVPAAGVILKDGGQGSTVLTRAIGQSIDITPRNEESHELFSYFVGRGLITILRQDPTVVLIIDGLDENRSYRGFDGLRLIRGQMKGTRCKTIISTRTKHFNLRANDFSQALRDRGRLANRRKGLQVVELLPWTEGTVIAHIERISQKLPSSQSNNLQQLIHSIRDGKALKCYGTLLNHPIYLDLIIDDVANDAVREMNRSSLVRSWILRKIKRDQRKYTGNPIGGDATTESRLIFSALEDLALQMSEVRSRIPLERAAYGDVVMILKEYGISGDEVFEILLKSVLVSVGLRTTLRDSYIIFSHRVFHEYMIASALVRVSEKPADTTPSEIVAFYYEMVGQPR